MLQKTASNNCSYWSKNAPTFYIPGVKIYYLSQIASIFCISGVKIDQLAKRSKPSKADKAYAIKTMDEMADWESHAFSAKFADEDGKLLAAYFSNRIRTTNKPLHATYIGGPQTPSQLHCSVDDLKEAQADDEVKLEFDGIPVSIFPHLRVYIHT